MKNYIKIVFILIAAIFASCQDSGDGYTTESGGYLSVLDMTISQELNTRSSDVILGVEIVASDNTIAASYPDHTDLPEKISLAVDQYTVTATNAPASDYAVFDTPIYGASKSIKITAGQVTQTSLVAEHTSALVAVSFSEEIIATFTDISVAVGNGTNSLTYGTDNSSIGYFSVPDNAKISYSISMTDTQGDPYIVTNTIYDVEPKDNISLTFSLGEGGDLGSDAAFRITVDETVNEIVRQEELTPKIVAAPVVTATGFDISQPIEIGLGNEAELLLHVDAEGGFETLGLRFSSEYFTSMSIPSEVSLIDMSEQTKALLQTIGVSTEGVTTSDTAADIDLSTMTGLLPAGDTLSMTHYISLIAVDTVLQSLIADITINVSDTLSSASVTTGSASSASSYSWPLGVGSVEVTLNGSVGYGNAPESPGFEYRKSGASTWTSVSAEGYESGDKSFSAIVDLSLKTTYQFRATSDEGAGSTVTFTTPWPTIPNLSFEDWYLSGSTWYPASDASSHYWMTGNGGVTAIGSLDSNATPEYDTSVSGTAVKLESIDGVLLVGFAAGNIFVGDFSINTSDTRSSVKFGRSYEGRPTQLTGYYRYDPATIDTHWSSDSVSAALYAEHAGETDQCHIYIILEQWGDGVDTRPDNPTQIGYGELIGGSTIEKFTSFSIDVDYSSTAIPDHIIIVATSSRYGEDFVGGAGSTLYIDEFDLEFN